MKVLFMMMKDKGQSDQTIATRKRIPETRNIREGDERRW